MTHETCIPVLQAQTHIIFYPDNGWGPKAGRYMWMDKQGQLLYFRYHGTDDKITEYQIYSECTEEYIKRGFYALEEQQLCEIKGFKNIALLQRLEQAYHRYLKELELLQKETNLIQLSANIWVGYHPIIGHLSLSVYSTGSKAYQTHWGQQQELLNLFFQKPETQAVAFTKAWTEINTPLFQYLELYFEQLKSGKYGLFRRYDSGANCFAFLHQRWVEMPLVNERLEHKKLVNPFIYLREEEEIVKWLMQDYFNENSQIYSLEALNELQILDFGLMEQALKTPKSQVLDDYIAAFKTGYTVSMGPTTDQRWTIYYEDGQFWTKGYEPTADGGYGQVVSPYTEEETRKVLSTYKIFGLWRLVD